MNMMYIFKYIKQKGFSISPSMKVRLAGCRVQYVYSNKIIVSFQLILPDGEIITFKHKNSIILTKFYDKIKHTCDINNIYNNYSSYSLGNQIKNCGVFSVLDLNLVVDGEVINNINMLLKSNNLSLYPKVLEIVTLMIHENQIRKKILNSNIVYNNIY